jgi:hypothetical protein
VNTGASELYLCLLTSCIEHVDLSAIARYGVKLGYTPDVLTDAGMYILPLYWAAEKNSPLT